jgi:uncharacterized protein
MSSDFADLDAALAGPTAPLAAAEAHGVLCGALCAVDGYRLEDWLLEVMGEKSAGSDTRGLLERIYSATHESLDGDLMDFAPLLPEDPEPIASRVVALAEWCGGFLYGMGVARPTGLSDVPGDVGEVLRDFSEISRADPASLTEGEGDEEAYAELVEFVRAGTQLLYEELAAARRELKTPGSALH